MRVRPAVVATAIVLTVAAIFVCAPKKRVDQVIVNTLVFPAGEILQTKGIDTIQYPSFEDAVILSGYDSLVILEAIQTGNKVDDYEFSPK